jgi:hypothetical protein
MPRSYFAPFARGVVDCNGRCYAATEVVPGLFIVALRADLKFSNRQSLDV